MSRKNGVARLGSRWWEGVALVMLPTVAIGSDKLWSRLQSVCSRSAIYGTGRGIICDGKRDIGPALQAVASELSQNTPAEIDMPSGICRLASAVVFKTAVQIVGQGFTEGATNNSVGTMIRIDQTGFVPITFSGQQARGSVIRNMGFFQVNHNALKSGWAPDSYDYVVKVLNTLGEVKFDHVLFNGVNKAIYAYNSGRLNIADVSGQFYTTAVEIDQSQDIPRIEHLHSWTYNSANRYVLAYEQENLDALLLGRCDGIFIGDLFSISGRSAIHFTRSTAGVTTKAYISNLYSDLTRYAIWVDEKAANTTFQYASITAQGNNPNKGATPQVGATAIQIDAPNVIAQGGNLRADLMYDNAITITASAVRLDTFSFWATGYNSRNNGAPAISTVVGDHVTLGSVFLQNGHDGKLANVAGTVFQAMAPDVTSSR